MIRKIRIGGVDFKLILERGLVEQSDALGMVLWTQEIIKLDAGLPNSMTRQALFHEINHIIWRQSSLGKNAQEERVAEVFGNGYQQVFADNPRLLYWLANGED